MPYPGNFSPVWELSVIFYCGAGKACKIGVRKLSLTVLKTASPGYYSWTLILHQCLFWQVAKWNLQDKDINLCFVEARGFRSHWSRLHRSILLNFTIHKFNTTLTMKIHGASCSIINGPHPLSKTSIGSYIVNSCGSLCYVVEDASHVE